MRVLVIGGSGFIGRYLVSRLGDDASYDVFATFRSRPPGPGSASWHRVDLTDRPGMEDLFRLTRPEVVVHLAAMADVGACERDQELATAINVEATGAITQLCGLHGCRMVYVSTEYVFDGGKGHYAEDDGPNPTTHYGRTKWQAERLVASPPTPWSVVRTSIVYGWPAPGRRNFVTWLIERLRQGQRYEGSTEVLRTPVFVEHLVDGISALVEVERPGIHHIAGSDLVSMYDFAVAVTKAFDLDAELVIPQCEGPGNPQGRDGPLTDRLGLDCTRTFHTLGLHQPGLAEGLAAMRATPKED